MRRLTKTESSQIAGGGGRGGSEERSQTDTRVKLCHNPILQISEQSEEEEKTKPLTWQKEIIISDWIIFPAYKHTCLGTHC